MAPALKTRIIKIGNSKGIRIPKHMLEQSNLGEDVELTLEKGQIILRSSRGVRQNWGESFKAMSERDDDQLLDAKAIHSTKWDETEWEW